MISQVEPNYAKKFELVYEQGQGTKFYFESSLTLILLASEQVKVRCQGGPMPLESDTNCFFLSITARSIDLT